MRSQATANDACKAYRPVLSPVLYTQCTKEKAGRIVPKIHVVVRNTSPRSKRDVITSLLGSCKLFFITEVVTCIKTWCTVGLILTNASANSMSILLTVPYSLKNSHEPRSLLRTDSAVNMLHTSMSSPRQNLRGMTYSFLYAAADEA